MINTTIGKIKANDFGNILMHEHIGCISNDLVHAFGKNWLDKEKLANFAVEILTALKKKHSVGLFVDGTPFDLGRDISLIKEVSARSNIPIVVSTGLYYYPSFFTAWHTETEIASWFIEEFENGIEGTDVKPGILKIASDFNGITKDNEKRLSAIAIAQKETNLPVYVHCVHKPEIAQNQLEILQRNINNPEKIIFGHTALNPDAEYLERILDKGCYICMDQCHCTKHSIDSIGKTLVTLCHKGYADKILLSNDLCIYTDFGPRTNTGFNLTVEMQIEQFGHIFNTVYGSFLENGGSEKDWELMFTKNPIKILDV